MLKVLVAALVGTVVGVAVMVTVIAIAGTDTEGSTSVGLGSLPLSTQSPTSTPAPSTGGSSGPSSTPSSGGSGDVAAGKTVFEANCASCHSAEAGTPSPLPAAPNLAELAPTLDTQTILDQIKNGGGPMPAGLVSGADADNVTAYILSLGQ
jgi:cytochrome c551